MADLDGDGQRELFTGCFEGGIYILPGQTGGKFAKPRALLDKSGAVLRLGQYWDDVLKWTAVETSKWKEELGIAAAAVDFDADGDQDLVLGSQQGHFFLRRNEGSPKAPAFATESEQLLSGGSALEVAGGHAMPSIADWDGDGLWDLVSGSDRGQVVWFRNSGKAGAPEFAAAQVLVPRSGGLGTRTQACAADYDGDGRLDLFVGDYHSERAGDKSVYHGYVWLYRRLPQAR